MNTPYLVEKIGSLLFVGIAICVFAPWQLLSLLIVMGQAHFILAYFYQYKAGKIGSSFLIRYILLLAVLWSLFYFYLSIEWIVVLVGTQFLIHFLLDETYLYQGRHSVFTALETIMLTTLYFGILYAQMFSSPSVSDYTAPVACVILSIYIALAFCRKYKPLIPSYPILTVFLILLGITLFDISIPAEILLGSVIIFHYCEWYIHFCFKLWNNKPALRVYLRNVLVVNIAIAGIYFFYVLVLDRTGIFQALFTTFYFYLWTLMHTLTSLRSKDLRQMFRLP